MKAKIGVFVAVLCLGLVALGNPAQADDKGSPKGSMMGGEVTAEVTETGAIKVGNTFCPISKEKIGEEGEIIEYEYEGKIYNFCCKMCLKDFNKDPEKYIQMINDSMASEGATEALGYEESHDGHDHQ
jgi:YHS domain-containing protein